MNLTVTTGQVNDAFPTLLHPIQKVSLVRLATASESIDRKRLFVGMRDHAAALGLPVALIDFANVSYEDRTYLGLMRAVASQLDPMPQAHYEGESADSDAITLPPVDSITTLTEFVQATEELELTHITNALKQVLAKTVTLMPSEFDRWAADLGVPPGEFEQGLIVKRVNMFVDYVSGHVPLPSMAGQTNTPNPNQLPDLFEALDDRYADSPKLLERWEPLERRLAINLSPDDAGDYSEAQTQYIEAFLNAIAQLNQSLQVHATSTLAQKTVILLDSFELATADEQIWVKQKLLPALHESLGEQLVVITGCKVDGQSPAAVAQLHLETFAKQILPSSANDIYLVDRETEGEQAFFSDSNQPINWELLKLRMENLEELEHLILHRACIPLQFERTLFDHLLRETGGRASPSSPYGFASERVERVLNNTILTHPEVTERQRQIKRCLLNIHFIRKHGLSNADYIGAHRSIYQFWLARQNENQPDHDNARLYHRLFCDPQFGLIELQNLIYKYDRAYERDVLDKLIHTAKLAEHFLQPSHRDKWPDFYRLQLLQLVGDWDGSLTKLETLEKRPTVDPELQAHITRAKGLAEANKKKPDYDTALNQLYKALKAFQSHDSHDWKRSPTELEIAQTRMEIGNARVGLVRAIEADEVGIRPNSVSFGRMSDIGEFLLSLPLVLYLVFRFSTRVLRPSFWSALHSLDWTSGYLLARADADYRFAQAKLLAFLNDKSNTASSEEHQERARLQSAELQNRISNLQLQIGDAAIAQEGYSALLKPEENGLSDHHKARLQAKLGESYLIQGNVEGARPKLQEAYDKFVELGDENRAANVAMLLAEIAANSSTPKDALPLLKDTLDHSTSEEDAFRASHAAAQLHRLTRNPRLSAHELKHTEQIIAQVEVKQFHTRFRDPFAAWFRQLTLGLLFVFGFIAFAITIKLRGIQSGIPTINYTPARLIDASTQFASTIGQEVAGLTLDFAQSPRVVLWQGLLIFVNYLLIAMLAGWFEIEFFTSTEHLQNKMETQKITLDRESLRRGTAEQAQEIILADVTQVIIADTTFIDRLMRDNSHTVVKTPYEQMAISAHTAHYGVLKELITKHAPQATVRDASFSLFHSLPGLLFLNSVFLFAIVMLMTQFGDTAQLAAPLIGNYSIADLHVYLYLGIFLPPLWWFVLQPMRLERKVNPMAPTELWVGGVGLGIMLLLVGIVVSSSRFVLTTPNIYPPLAVIIMIGAAVWRMVDRFLNANQLFEVNPIRAPSQRAVWLAEKMTDSAGRLVIGFIAVQLLLIVSIIMGGYLVREIKLSHQVIHANAERNHAATGDNSAVETERWLRAALDSYSIAITGAEVDYFGLESSQSLPELLANRATVQMSLADLSLNTTVSTTVSAETPYYEAAIKDLNDAISKDDQQGRYHLWLGFVHHTLADPNTDEGQEHLKQAKISYEAALAIEGSGMLNDVDRLRAQTGLGWIIYQTKSEDFGQTWFEDAINDPLQQQAAQSTNVIRSGIFGRQTSAIGVADSLTMTLVATANAHLGHGYSLYALGQQIGGVESESYYLEAREAWERSAELTSAWDGSKELATIHANALYSLGIANWKMGGKDKDARCDYYDQSLNHLKQSTQVGFQADEMLAFSYRTIGQLYWLAGEYACWNTIESNEVEAFYHALNVPAPTHSTRLTKTVAFGLAVDNYDKAIELIPDHAWYLQMRGRLSYVLWEVNPINGPSARVELIPGLRALDRAFEIDPIDGTYLGLPDYRPNFLMSSLRAEATTNTIVEGRNRLATIPPNFKDAYAYLKPVAEYQTGNVTLAFDTGLAALGNNDPQEAIYWYQEGITRIQRADTQRTTLPYAILDLQTTAQAYITDTETVEILLGLLYEQANSYTDLYDSALLTQLVDAANNELSEKAYVKARHTYALVMDTMDHPPYTIQLSAAFAAFATDDLETAQRWYISGIQNARAKQDNEAILLAWNQIHRFDPSPPEMLQALFPVDELDLSLFPEAELLFRQARTLIASVDGVNIEQSAETTQILERYTDALLALQSQPNLELLQNELVELHQLPDSAERDAVFAMFRQRFVLLSSQASSRLATQIALEQGWLALAIGDVERAATLYNGAFIAHVDESTEFTSQRAIMQRDLKRLWELSGDTILPLLAALETDNEETLIAHPHLDLSAIYWRRRAWFLFDMGKIAFFTDNVAGAEYAIQSGQLSADKSAELEGEYGNVVNTYLPEAALGRYHILKGDQLAGQGNYQEALTLYEGAIATYAPDTNVLAKQGLISASFKKGLMQFALGEIEAAQSSYEQALIIANRYRNQPKVGVNDRIQFAMGALNELDIGDEQDAAQTVIMDLLSAGLNN